MAGKTLKIHIYEAGDFFRIHPPVLEVDGGDPGGGGAVNPDRVRFRNHTNEEVVVYTGPGLLSAGSAAEPVAKGGQHTKPVRSQGNGNDTFFTYQVFGVVTGRRGKGNSDPVIIIEN